MELKGELKDIIYQNEINSYTIGVLETDEEEITVVGYLPFIHVGDNLNIIGKYVTHQEYGRQFKIETFEKRMPETLDSIERYLANGAIKGVGPATAKKIINEFGKETIVVLRFESHKLANIKGITKQKALEIGQEFNENWEQWQIVGFLDRFGIGAQNSKNVYKALGTNAIQEIESNPYVLVDVANNVDFKQIDKMAMELGIPYNHENRVKSGIKHALLLASANGHCMVLKENLYEYVKDLLGVIDEDIDNSIIELKVKGEIVLSKVEDNEWLFLSYFYKAERNVEERLLELKNAKNVKEIKNIEKEIKKIEKDTELELSEKQKEAVKLVNENNVCIITGGPGTGKTTIIKVIIDLYKSYDKKPVLCAPTGRAAKRMTETTGEEAKTLHRLLEIGKSEDKYDEKSVDVSTCPIDGDVIIVDEMSMVDLFLMNYLVNALYKGTKLVLVGDIDQLPSVGPGSILSDLIKSGEIPSITLDKIFRQAAKSKIILNAHRVNKGEVFIKENEVEEKLDADFFFIKENNQDNILEQVISLCAGRLKKFGNFDFFKQIQVITPTKKGILGTKELNIVLQNRLNPHIDGDIEKQMMGATFRVNDRVMQIKNNYDIAWTRKEPKNEIGNGVFNGELGRIKKIDDTEKTIKILFDDGKTVWYEYSDLEQIEHAYAITVHKAQRK